MSLGPDNTICRTEFTEAMRPIAGDNVDLEQVQANLGALGQAVYNIARNHADTISDAADDAPFWAWVAAVNDWLEDLSDWRTGVTAAFAAWAAATPAENALKAAIAAVAAPGAPPAAPPTALRGRIE